MSEFSGSVRDLKESEEQLAEAQREGRSRPVSRHRNPNPSASLSLSLKSDDYQVFLHCTCGRSTPSRPSPPRPLPQSSNPPILKLDRGDFLAAVSRLECHTSNPIFTPPIARMHFGTFVDDEPVFGARKEISRLLRRGVNRYGCSEEDAGWYKYERARLPS